ncbi:hypothetical protein MA16_Dca019825 [Dendrobium catenatum]|uniref:Uncharacterized protein n=1 Tax=Dendrobium catenatum TaxID=906689 RepID=A0A2I0X6P5_9ASPA|nr:hypothetical protein MA16_Dca019825 [Dendrobium catenatum]
MISDVCIFYIWIYIEIANCHWTPAIIGPSSDICQRPFTSYRHHWLLAQLLLVTHLQTFSFRSTLIVNCQRSSTQLSIANRLSLKKH